MDRRRSRIILLVLLGLSILFQSGLFRLAFGQESARNRPYRRDRLDENWNRRGRSAPSQESAAALRLRAYRQKMAMRMARASGPPKHGLGGAPTSGLTPAGWAAVGPAPLASDATGDGMQDYNWVSGRATSVLIDPADTSGNTVLLGGAYGGLWKSKNAGSLNSSPSSVVWQALIDDQPTLAVGAIALQPGNSNVVVVGTGETNGSGDSYYGLGILRSSNGGSTWTQITGKGQPADQSFLGIGFSKIAFSTANPSLVVAATAGDNGLDAGLEEDGKSTARGLYYSQDAGVTWNRAALSDGAVPASATAVIYNPSQGASGTFYAFIRRHGLYSSTDGQHFTRVGTQPTAGLASANCPAGSNASTCLIYRGEFAVVPGRNEMYLWIVDVQPDENGNPQPFDEGIWQSTNGGTNWTQIPDNGITNCGDSAFGPYSGCGVEQGWYNLALAAIPDGTGVTDIYAGAVNLYKCTLELGQQPPTCNHSDWFNLTHVYGCNPGPLGEPAHVHPDQHEIAFPTLPSGFASGKAPGYFAHDGGISRTLDGYTGLTTGSCTGTNQFDSLSQTLGSMTEFVAMSVHPTSADVLLGGTQDNGSPTTSSATTSTTWQNALGGDGGFNAINPANPDEWFAANPYVTILKCELGTACNDSGFSEVVSSASLGGDQGAFYTPYILDPQNSGEMLVGTCRVWRISTSGTAPLQLSNDFDTLGTGVCTGGETNLVMALAAGGPKDVNGNSKVVYAVTNGYGPLSGAPGGEVWVTTNAGVSLMTNVSQNLNPNGYAISTVAIDKSDPSGDTAYVGIMGFSTSAYPTSHVWKTTNAGAIWTDWSGTGFPDAPVNVLLVDPQAGQIYAGTDVGVFVSSTSTASWEEVGPAPGPGTSGFLPNAPVSALQFFNPDSGTKTLVASTYGRGIWNFPLVTSPNYTNDISNSPQTVFPGQTAMFAGTLTAENGYASPVNLSCTGVHPNSCSVQPSQITPTAGYTLTAGGLVGDYGFNAHAVGTDAHTITRDASVTLHVVDFGLTAPAPNSLTVGQGGVSGASTFQVTASGSFAGTVTLRCSSGLPAGAACVFSPSSSVDPTSSTPVTVALTVTAASGTPVGGPTIVTISATTSGAPAPKTQTFNLTVTAPTPDFAMAVTPTPSMTVAGQNVTWNGTLTALNGYSGTVTLSCTAGAPATCGSTPAALVPTAGGTAFTVTLGNAATGTFNFAIRATDGTLTHTTPAEALAVGTDVGWTDTGSSSVTVAAGQSATYQFSATPTGGNAFSSTVSFSCASLPVLTSCGFSPATIAAGAGTTTVTLTISTTGPSSVQRSVAQGAVAGAAPVIGNRGYPIVGGAVWLVLAGFFGVRGRRRARPGLPMLLVVGLGLGVWLSCGGVAGGGGTPPPAVVVTPGLATVFANVPGNSWPLSATQQQFEANQSVTWAVTGGSANGTISGSGLYTTPAAVPSPATITVTATTPTSSASAFVTVAAPTPPGTSQITVNATATGGPAHGTVVALTVQ